MSTVEHIDSLLEVPYGNLSKKEIEYCLNVIKVKRHEVIYNTTTKLYIKMAKHALAKELWNLCSKCCKYITYMINNYKVDNSCECELYLLYGYLISKTPYEQKKSIKKKKVYTIYATKVKNDIEAIKHSLTGFNLAIKNKNKEIIINSILFMWNIMEFWLSISREFSYIFLNILKSFDDTVTEMSIENKKWMMFIKYELTKCLIDIKKYNYNFQKLKLKNIGKNNMDIDFNANDNSIFPENSYLKHILANINEDHRLTFYILIQKTLQVLSTGDYNDLIMKKFKEISTLAKTYDFQSFPDFLELYIKFILNNFKKSESKKHITSIINELKINENEKIYISLIKCEKKIPLKPEKIDKLYKKIDKYNTYIIENEEEGHYINFENYIWSPQSYFIRLVHLTLISKNYIKAKEIIQKIKFSGYTDKVVVLKKNLLELYIDLEEYKSNPSLVLLSEPSIDFQLKILKKIKEYITTYEKQDGDKNFIQKSIQDMWNYMFPLLQQKLYPRIKPYIEFLHETLERIESPLFILRSVIGQELSKICENDLEYTKALKYLKFSYLIVNDYNGLLKSNNYRLLNLKCNTSQNEVTVEETLYLKVEEIRKSHNSIPDEELENILKIYLNDFTNTKRDMDVEEVIQKKYIPENYKMRYIKEFNTNNRCKTVMMTLLKIIDLAFQRKIYSIAFDGASIIIFNEWISSFQKLDYFKISMSHISRIRAFIILHYWKLFKNNKEQLKKNINYNNKNYDALFNMNNSVTLYNNKLDYNNSKSLLNSSETISENKKINPSTKYFDYYDSLKDSLYYKEKLMEDVIRSINIGLELNKQW
ncbi:hypothetical protein BCR36DRAFT_350942 [Piromyces finnis]|uniref:Uncharacterized protein n=1 Tax=Piromyces finnis TaxID=1754191 RepID=A0A1Y1VBP2_9FUNG|nr:hypothetical protein BCR36DRAFT_350942 [Piromyces finnis]|eukprot:ORX51361.1 hypothetical protein BCR36DRAFT_350942 [Piromyces finnis]